MSWRLHPILLFVGAALASRAGSSPVPGNVAQHGTPASGFHESNTFMGSQFEAL
jgi:hypothetical protein